MSGNNKDASSNEGAYAGRGLALGLLFGAALGLVMWLVTDSFVFFPVFLGAGLAIGLALDDARAKHEEE